MTRVLVDLLFQTGTKGGMESYVRNLYRAMPQRNFEFVALASAELASADTSWFPGEVIDSGIRGDDRRAWAWGELTAVNRAARRAGAELIHSPANLGPWSGRTPVVLTVHDLLPFRHPDFVPGPYAAVLRTLIRRSARHAATILTISEASKADIVGLLGRRPGEVEVVPLAGPEIGGTAAVARDPKLIIALGNRLPHKNFEAIVRALPLIPVERRPRLVVTGGQGKDPLAAVAAECGVGDWVESAGWVTDAQVDSLYERAAAVVVPSLFEGFGLPVLEGMARGCPVICSDLPVLHEVAGDAAMYFDPHDPRSLADAIVTVVTDPARGQALRDGGLRRAAGFSWDRTAERTEAAFQRVLA